MVIIHHTVPQNAQPKTHYFRSESVHIPTEAVGSLVPSIVMVLSSTGIGKYPKASTTKSGMGASLAPIHDAPVLEMRV